MPTPSPDRLNDGTRVPIPDPTTLTTAQLQREIAALKEIMFTRLDGMDKAVVAFNESITRVPTDVDKQVGHLKELVEKTLNERFASIVAQFVERDVRHSQGDREMHESILAVKAIIETRIDGMDKAIELLQMSTDRLPDFIESTVSQLRELHDERFRSIEVQFKERDTRTDQTSKDSKVAVDAALKAQQEAFGEQSRSSALAIAKSEAATMKQFDQMGATAAATNKATDERINDLKERQDRNEGKSTGLSTGAGILFAVIGAVALVAGVVIAAIALVHH